MIHLDHTQLEHTLAKRGWDLTVVLERPESVRIIAHLPDHCDHIAVMAGYSLTPSSTSIRRLRDAAEDLLLREIDLGRWEVAPKPNRTHR